jgi:hypothetical protein
MNEEPNARPRQPFIPVWLGRATMPPIDFRILCNLWSRWNPKRRQCNPGADTIARDCGFDRKTVFPALRRLEEGGWIKRLGKPFGGSNRYLPIIPSHGTIEGLPIVPPDGTPIVPSHGTPIVPPDGTGRYTSEGTQVNDLATGSAVAGETGELFPALEAPVSMRNEPNPAPTPEPKAARKRDELLDALASLDGSDLAQVTDPCWGACRKAKKEILKVSPGVTPEEIRRRADNYCTHHPGLGLGANALAKHWAKCDRPPIDRSQPAKPDAPLRMISQ